MAELEQLLLTIKRELRAQRKNYRDVAVTLGLSEASVKRMFSAGSMSMDRFAKIALLLGYSLAELTAKAAATTAKLDRLSLAQEKELVSDSALLLVAVCALNHWSMAEIVGTYRMTEAECLQRLLRLERLRLINLLPGNRIRVTVGRDFEWQPNGPIREYFESSGQADFLNSKFSRPGEQHFFSHGMLSEEAQREMEKAIQALRQRFAGVHAESVATPFAGRRGVGLLLAFRAWEPEVFAKYRR